MPYGLNTTIFYEPNFLGNYTKDFLYYFNLQKNKIFYTWKVIFYVSICYYEPLGHMKGIIRLPSILTYCQLIAPITFAHCLITIYEFFGFICSVNLIVLMMV